MGDWTTVKVNGEVMYAKDFLDGVLIDYEGDEHNIYAAGWRVKIKEGDMDDNGLVRRRDG